MISSFSACSQICWMAQHLLSKTHAAASATVIGTAVQSCFSPSWLTGLGSEKMEESWDARRTIGKFVLKSQASCTQQSSREKSPLLSRNHWWDSPAQRSQSERCCLVWQRRLPWAWMDGEGCANSCCVDTAALEQHPKCQPRTTPRSPPLS